MKNKNLIKLLLTLTPLSSSVLPIIACKSPQVEKDGNENNRIKSLKSQAYAKTLLIAKEQKWNPDTVLKDLLSKESLFKGEEKKEITYNNLFANDELMNKFFNNEKKFNKPEYKTKNETNDFAKFVIDMVLDKFKASEFNLEGLIKSIKPDQISKLIKNNIDKIKPKIEKIDKQEIKKYTKGITELTKKVLDDMNAGKSYKELIKERSEDLRLNFLKLFNIENPEIDPQTKYENIFSDEKDGEKYDWAKDFSEKFDKLEIDKKIEYSSYLVRLIIPVTIFLNNLKTMEISLNVDEDTRINTIANSTYEGFKNKDVTIGSLKRTIEGLFNEKDNRNVLTLLPEVLKNDNFEAVKNLIEPISFIMPPLPKDVPDIIAKGLRDARVSIGQLIPLLNIPGLDVLIFPKIKEMKKKYLDPYLNLEVFKAENADKMNFTFFEDLIKLLTKINDQIDELLTQLKAINNQKPESYSQWFNTFLDLLSKKDNQLDNDSILGLILKIAKNHNLTINAVSKVLIDILIKDKISEDYWKDFFVDEMNRISVEDENINTVGNDISISFTLNKDNKNYKFKWLVKDNISKIVDFSQD